ncbi:hypothetical protein [Actinacidiphila reveromycinica]|uniref:hypothetical protein n=1 Tax=Actinacidiphila reveromycinica TaxID=659352 RepID=UPI00192299C7|nr:hypothetical protein [Streptomyces sp. SN-593]
MPDDVSAGETYRRLQDHEARTQREHEALDTRITNLARDTVPLRLYQQTERDRDDDMKAVTDRVAKIEDRPAISLARWLGILTVAAAFLALAVQAYGTLKGAQ